MSFKVTLTPLTPSGPNFSSAGPLPIASTGQNGQQGIVHQTTTTSTTPETPDLSAFLDCQLDDFASQLPDLPLTAEEFDALLSSGFPLFNSFTPQCPPMDEQVLPGCDLKPEDYDAFVETIRTQGQQYFYQLSQEVLGGLWELTKDMDLPKRDFVLPEVPENRSIGLGIEEFADFGIGEVGGVEQPPKSPSVEGSSGGDHGS